jgi:enamine deaminase RidA (YjgF/YER057c/UK114 family)
MSATTTTDSHTWIVDIVHSTVGFMARHMMISKVRGSFTRVKGEVQLPEGSSIPLSIAGEIEAGSVDTRDEGRTATRLAALDALAIAKEHLGSLDRIVRAVRLGVMLVTSTGFLEQPKMADAASELFRGVFGVDRIPVRLVFGVASLPLGMPVELDVIFEVA